MSRMKAYAARHPLANSFGIFVQQRRKELLLTQIQLGKRVGCSGPYVSKIERGEKHIPTTYLLIRLSLGLELPLSELMVRGGLIEKCRYPEYLDTAVESIDKWRSFRELTESARVVEQMAKILCENSTKVAPDLRHLLNPLKLHAETLKRELRVSVSAPPTGVIHVA